MRRLPIRWQVTLAFAAALALVLLAVGAFVVVRFDAELARAVDSGLRSRLAEVAALVRRPGATLAGTRSLEPEESFAHRLAPSGAVLDGTSGAPDPRLTATELRRAAAGPVFLDRAAGTEDGEPARLLAAAVRPGGDIAVVGASLDDQREARSALLALGGLGFLVALALASAAGYWVSGIALRPVDAMRREAEAITETPDRRLPVPPVDDEIGRLGVTLNAMLARLERARAGERRFIADASHELRTPLTVLKSEIEVALLADRTPAELRLALASAGEEADRLVGLAEDLLVLSRAGEGGRPPAPRPVEVTELLAAVAARHAGRAASAGREIAVDAPAGLRVTADPQWLDRALENLLENALRHGWGRIDLTARDGGRELRITVRDHGSGFPSGFAERAFDRFSRPDAGRSGGGAGLGLAIVAAIARAHGGAVQAADAGPGALVAISLPAGSSIPHPDRAR